MGVVKVIIFDVGGVLIENAYIPLLRQLAEENGLDFTNIKWFAAPFFNQAMLGQITEAELFEKISQHFGLLETGEGLDTRIGELFLPIGEVWEYVKQLKDRYRLAILSDLGSGWIKRHEREFEFAKYFEQLFYSSRLGIKKPDPQLFQHVLEAMRVTADECVFIDDKIENVNAARGLGMWGIVYQNPGQLKRDLEQSGVSLTE